MLVTMTEYFWGSKAKVRYLMIAAIFLFFTFLGGREIWTQEHRWADIVAGMFFRGDFLHPYLGKINYYDKPLLSYWLIAFVAKLNQELTIWSLRFPSAMAGLLALWAIYRLGAKLKNKQLGLLSGWLLLTTFYFLFWVRTSSADMLNLAGTLLAISWYYEKREQAQFTDYAIFFFILALTSLCKGLVGAIVPLIAVVVDIYLNRSWKQHLRLPLLLALMPAMIIYLAPFYASAYFNSATYGENGLYLVYRENILRYFKPFDHQGSIYTYFIYLPVYLLPCTILFIPAVFSLKSRWQRMQIHSRWIALTLLALFIFFSLSGSRRSYYVLPMVPFAILLTADWILSGTFSKRHVITSALLLFSFTVLYIGVDLVPQWYYNRFGAERFAASLKVEASKIQPWEKWNVVSLDAASKLNFYLHLPPSVIRYHIKGDKRYLVQTQADLLKCWPILKSINNNTNTIYITRKSYVPLLESFLTDYRKFEVDYPDIAYLRKPDEDIPVAFIPRQ